MQPPSRPEGGEVNLMHGLELTRRMQARLFWLSATMAALGAIGYGLFFLLEGPRVFVLVEVALLALVGALAMWVRRTGRADRGLAVIMGAVALLLAGLMWLQGGLGAPTTWWLMVLPFIWMLVGTVRGGLILGGAVLLLFMLTPVVLPRLGWPNLMADVQDPALHHAASMTGALVLYGVFVAFSLRLRHELEDELVRALREVRASRDEAWAASQVKARFLATMSHEIRTPINGILGATELLRTTPLDGRQQQVVGLQRQSLDSLMALVNDVLDYSRLDAGRLELEDLTVDLQAVVFDALELSAAAAHERALELTCTIGDGVPALIRSDPARLRQALAHLVSTLVRVTPAGGVHVQVEAVPGRSTTTDGLALNITVQDTGAGVPEPELGGLLDAFATDDANAAHPPGGPGLRLAICREIVALMGGRISVTRRAQGGVAFAIHLPVCEAADPVAPPAHATPLGTRVVLVASYHPLVTHVRRILQSLGVACEVKPVLPTLAELGQAGAQGVSAVLIDERMLGAHGGRARLEQVSREAGLPVLLMCGMTSDSTFATLDGVFVLYKPVRPRSLVDGLIWAEHARPTDRHASARVVVERPVSSFAGRVLLVEDNPVNQVMTQAMLERLGLSVVIAGDGHEALARYGEQTFDMVLMDVQMPGMDGLAATERLRSLEAAAARQRTPVVAVTGNPEPDMRARGQAAGMDDFLGKPFTLEQLEHMLLRWRPGLAP